MAATENRARPGGVPRLTEEVAMRVRWMGTAALTVAILGAGGPVAAGGAWLETGKQYYSPDSPVTARGTFGSGAYNGRVSDGPYYAYLLPGSRWLDRPGPIPDYAIPLGPMTIRRATGNYCCWVATVTFTVPDVTPGRYNIDYCNDPCTVDGLGDLIGGTFFVGESEQEARLMARIERLEGKADRLSRTRADLRRTEAALAEAREQYDQLVGRLRAARSEGAPAPVEATNPADRPLSAWPVVAGLVVLAAGAWFRRRLGQPAIPDFVPEEMVRENQVPSRQPMTSSGSPAISMPAPPRTKS